MKKETNLTRKLRAFSALTRWGETWDFCLLITLLGSVAFKPNLDWKFVLLYLANFTGLSFAFMINDIEDAEDDEQDEKKKLRNPITNGSISKEEGYIYTSLVFLISLVLYTYVSSLSGSILPLLTGLSILLISFFYSLKSVRLKNIPVVDLLSHSYMLAGGQFLVVYFAYTQIVVGKNLDFGFYLFFVLLLGSMYGQLENEVRDYETDKKLKMKTVAVLLGIKASQVLQIVLLLLVGVLSVWIIVNIKFPLIYIAQGIFVFVFSLIYPLSRNFVYKDRRMLKNDIHRVILLSIIATLFMYAFNLRVN